MSKGQIVSQTELAAIFGVTTRTIREWKRLGLPVHEEGGQGRADKYMTSLAIRWREEHVKQELDRDYESITEQEAKRRKELAHARLAELDLAVKTAEVVPVEAVAQLVSSEYAVVRSKINALPGGLASDLVDMTAAEIQERLADAIAEVLNGLTADEYYGSINDSVDGGAIKESATGDAEAAAKV